MTSHCYKMSTISNPNLSGRQRNMLLIDEFFMFLCRIKCGLMAQDLAIRFNCHISTVSRKIITSANSLYFDRGSINIWSFRDQIDRKMPDCFKTETPASIPLGSKSIFHSRVHTHGWDWLV